jgi:hypothetical protein
MFKLIIHSDLLALLSVISLIFASYFDCSQLFARLSFEAREKIIVLAIANWWQYISRLCNMGFAMIVAISYELKLNIEILNILIMGYLGAIILVIAYIKSSGLEKLASGCLNYVIFLPSRDINQHRYWRSLNFIGVRHVLISFLYYVMVQTAIVVPLIFANFMPDYRMTAVYVGQIVNFISTFLLMNYVDPLINKTIDDERHVGYADGLIVGRVLALITILAFLTIFRFSTF